MPRKCRVFQYLGMGQGERLDMREDLGMAFEKIDFGSSKCPNCGWDADENGEDYLEFCVISDEFVPSLSTESYTWVENWTCPECGTAFWFWNGE